MDIFYETGRDVGMCRRGRKKTKKVSLNQPLTSEDDLPRTVM